MEANMEQKDNEIVDLSCPVADVQKIVHGKWSMVLIYFLSKETLRFGELK
jgi:DNA-binding HxlR family transcriptional regulator